MSGLKINILKIKFLYFTILLFKYIKTYVCAFKWKKITYVYVYLLIIEKKYKKLELAKLEFHITRNSSLVSSITIEEKKRALRSSFVFTNKLSLVSLSIVLHGTQVYQAWVPCGIFSIQKSTPAQVFFMKLECLKLNLYRKLKFHELKFQKTGILLLIL